jgi:hypothetical protein
MLLVDAMLKLHRIELGLLDYHPNGEFTKKRIALEAAQRDSNVIVTRVSHVFYKF